MADYKTLVNDTLSELGETQITTIGSNAGVQEFVEKAVLKAVYDINNEEKEWPYLINSSTQTLTPGVQEYALPATYRSIDWESFFVRPLELFTNTAFTSDITGWTDNSSGTGSAAYTSTGNGRARLAGGSSGVGALEQSVSTIANLQYRIIFRIFSNTLTLNVGTTTGATDIVNASTFSITNAGEGTFHVKDFTATGASTFIELTNTANNNCDLDLATVSELTSPNDLKYVDYDEWLKRYKDKEDRIHPDSYDKPLRVYRTQDDKFGVSPIPDKGYEVTFFSWLDPTVMTANTSTPSIPTEWHTLIVERALFYVYRYRHHDLEMYTARDNFKDGIKKMRRKLMGNSDSMKDNRIWAGGTTTGKDSY